MGRKVPCWSLDLEETRTGLEKKLDACPCVFPSSLAGSEGVADCGVSALEGNSSNADWNSGWPGWRLFFGERRRSEKKSELGAKERSPSAESRNLMGARTGRRRLRILLIGHQFQVPTEGQAKAAALSAFEDLDVSVLCPERYREAEVRWRHPKAPDTGAYLFRTTVVRNAWCGPAKWYLQWYPRLEDTLCALNPDVVDLWEEPWSLLSAQVSALKSRLLTRCRFLSQTEQNIPKNLPPPFEWFRSQTFKNADYLVARNTEAISVARTKGYKGRAKVVGNGVDTRLFSRMDRFACRKEMGVVGFVVGYAGRLVEEKGLETLLSAVRGMHGDACLLLSGDGPLRSELCREPFVKWAGSLPRETLPVFYNALDVLVLPSLTTDTWKEQFGRVIVEAQSCGVPVIGSNSGAIPEVVGNAGLVFMEGDENGLQIALNRLRTHPEYAAQLAEAGRLQALQRYSWEAIAKQMREVYLACASEGSEVPAGGGW